MALPPVGATATLADFPEFQRGIAKMNSDIAAMGKTTDQTAKTWENLNSKLNIAEKVGSALGGVFRGVSAPIKGASEKADDFFTSLAKWDITKKALSIVQDLGQSIISSGVEMLRTAASADELRVSAQFIGGTFGRNAELVDADIKGIQDLGIRYDVAARTATNFYESQLDISKAADLVRVSQGAAFRTGEDSSAILDRLLYGIRTLQPEVLRTAGITVSLEEALKGAGQGMSGAEKQQALFNATLEKGSMYLKQGEDSLSLYEVSLQEPLKRLRSLDRVTYEISRTVGANFKPSLQSAVLGLEYFDKSILSAVSDGGMLHDFLLNFGATTGVFSEQILGMAKSATDMGISFTSNMGASLSGAAESALSWGVNIVAQLADGIIQGASDALITAMDFIGSILSSFLSPGSPPKVAPGIDAWGAAAMDEYLKGFSEADYSILESVQGPLQSVLDMLGRSGDFGALNAELAQGLAAVGDGAAMSAAFLSKLSAIGGVYGQEIANLITRQTDLAAATKNVTDADAAYEAQQATVAQLTKEYEDLASAQETQAAGPGQFLGGYEKDRFKVRAVGGAVAGGAAAAEKKAALDAAKAKLDVLDQERKAAKEREAQAKSLLNLQEKLVKQLIAQAQWQDRLAKQAEAAQKAAAKAAEKKPVVPKKGAGAGAGAMGGLAGGLQIPKIGALVNEELDKAKAAITEKLGTIFQPLTNLWKKYFGEEFIVGFDRQTMQPIKKKIPGALQPLFDSFDELSKTVGKVFDEIALKAKPVTDAIAKLIPPDVLKQIGEFIGIAAVAGGGILGVQFVLGLAASAVGALGVALLGLAANPVVLAAVGIALVAKALDSYGASILGADAATATFGQRIQVGFWGILNDAATTVATVGKIIEFKFWETLNNAATTVATIGAIIQVKFWEFLNKASVWATTLLTNIGNFFFNTLNAAWLTVQTIGAIIAFEFWNFLNNASTFAAQLLETIRATIETKITEARAKWKEITDKIAEGWKALWEGVKAKFEELWGAVEKSLTAAKTFFYNTFFKPIKDWVDELAHGLDYLIGLFEDLKELAGKVGAKVAAALPGGKPAGTKQGGGPVTAGLWQLHDQEYVLSERMRSGQQAISPSALSLAALSRLVSTPARNGMAAVPAAAMGGGDITRNVSVEVNPTYQQVQSPASLYYDVMSALHAARV